MLNIMTEANTLDESLTIPTQLIEAQKLPTLILGGGFTGLFTALHLSHQHYQTPTILIDRDSKFIFKPLLYEFLTGEMNTRYICPRYDTLLHGIELTATLADLLPNWYAALGGDITDLRVMVIQRGQQILKGHTDKLRQTALTALQERNVAVELLLETEVIEVRPNTVVLQRNNQIEELLTATMIWTTGTAINPLIDTLSIPEANRDKQGRLKLTNTLQLLDFPEVFAGGDCTVMEHPLPATAQVAYQQGAAIAHNLTTIAEGHLPEPVEIGLRGILLKLGLDESVADLDVRVMGAKHLNYEVKGHLGHLIRQAAYVDLLPTPARNFTGTIEWLSDELFNCVIAK